MNILVCSSYNDAWNSVRPEAEIFIEWAKMGHKVTILTQGSADYVERFQSFGIKVIDAYPRKKIDLTTIKAIRKELAQHPYDIVYAMNSKTIPNAAFACVGFGSTRLVTYRGTVGGLYRHDPTAYLTHLHPRVDGVICVANAVKEDVQKRVWRKNMPITTIYKGHDLSWYQATPLKKADLGVPEDAICAICIANARPSKGVHVLLDSAKSLSKLDNLHILLVGRDMDTPDNLTLAKESGMENRIHFLGYRNDVPELLATSDMQLQPSISGEGLPKTIIEAMAMAKPSIVTTTGGGKELIKQGETGFVIPVNDALSLANHIEMLYSDQERRISMGKLAQQRLKQEFSLHQTALRHLEFFESLCHVERLPSKDSGE